MDERLPRGLPAAALVAAASGWMATAGNAPLWRELHGLGIAQAPGGALLTLTLAGVLLAALHGLLSLAAWRGLLKPAIVLLLFATATGGYFMWTYGVVIDRTMATNVLQTDWHEARDLVTLRFGLVLLVGAALPSWLAWRTPVRHRPWKQQALRNLACFGAALAVTASLILLSFQPLASTMRNHKHLRYLLNPLNTAWAIGQGAFGTRETRGAPAPVGEDARVVAGGRPRLLVLVLGETGRSGNFGINGYPRSTTPELAALQAASFRQAWSCGTSTAASVPCMFSPLGREGFLARERDAENLLDVLQHAGLAVLWLENQAGGCKGVCDRVPTVQVAEAAARAQPQLCPHGECFDEALLAGLDERLAQLPAQQRARGVVLVMHQMGSHGPAYAQRTPAAFKRFLPECTSSHLPDCDREQLRNAYDNTIAYTDHVLGATIRWLQRRTDYDGALLYVADHGESLGENNLYLHGLPYAIAPDVQKHVPWVTWLSPAFEQHGGLSMDCLRSRADVPVTHDHLFHSVLGLLQVSTSAYRRALDAYAGCAPH